MFPKVKRPSLPRTEPELTPLLRIKPGWSIRLNPCHNATLIVVGVGACAGERGDSHMGGPHGGGDFDGPSSAVRPSCGFSCVAHGVPDDLYLLRSYCVGGIRLRRCAHG